MRPKGLEEEFPGMSRSSGVRAANTDERCQRGGIPENFNLQLFSKISRQFHSYLVESWDRYNL